MHKKDLVDAVADRHGLNVKTVNDVITSALELIVGAVAEGDKVSFTGFGSFERAHRAARVGRNPSTGASVEIAESWGPKFSAGQTFKQVVNEGGKAAAGGAQ